MGLITITGTKGSETVNDAKHHEFKADHLAWLNSTNPAEPVKIDFPMLTGTPLSYQGAAVYTFTLNPGDTSKKYDVTGNANTTYPYSINGRRFTLHGLDAGPDVIVDP